MTPVRVRLLYYKLARDAARRAVRTGSLDDARTAVQWLALALRTPADAWLPAEPQQTTWQHDGRVLREVEA